MTKGLDKQLVRQTGEHLIAAELGRLGYVAAPFAGNVPLFDLLASNPAGVAVPVQVKAIKGASWQFSADSFLKIEFQDNGKQVVKGPIKLLRPDLLCVFVRLGEVPGTDEYYIFRLSDLQHHFEQSYKSRLRPKNPKSLHCAVWPKDLEQYKDNWMLVKKLLGPSDGSKARGT